MAKSKTRFNKPRTWTPHAPQVMAEDVAGGWVRLHDYNELLLAYKGALCQLDRAAKRIGAALCHNAASKAPWPDFTGHDIHEGDTIEHPSGERGTVVFLAHEADPGDQWRVDYGGGNLSRLCLQIGDKGRAVVTPNVELTGAKPALSAERPATEGSEVERRVGGGCETGKPLFELHGPSGEHWTIYENGTYTGFPDGTWIVNRAITEMDLLRGRIKQLDGSLIADE